MHYSVLATASYDQTVAVLDLQNQENRCQFTLPHDPEVMHWHPHNENILIVSTEGGLVLCYDIANGGDEPCLMIQAHEAPVCGMSINSVVPGLLATCSPDKTLKLWDISNPENVVLLHTKEGKVCAQVVLSFVVHIVS